MLKYLLPLPMLALPAMAQQADPVQRLETEWTAYSVAQQHMAAALIELRNAYVGAEAQKATLIEWLKEAQAKAPTKPQAAK